MQYQTGSDDDRFVLMAFAGCMNVEISVITVILKSRPPEEGLQLQSDSESYVRILMYFVQPIGRPMNWAQVGIIFRCGIHKLTFMKTH